MNNTCEKDIDWHTDIKYKFNENDSDAHVISWDDKGALCVSITIEDNEISSSTHMKMVKFHALAVRMMIKVIQAHPS